MARSSSCRAPSTCSASLVETWCLARSFKQLRQTPMLGFSEQPSMAEHKLEAAKHWPSRNGREAAQGKRNPAGCLPGAGVDDAKVRPVDQHPDGNAPFAQQTLELLVGARLPALQRTALVGVGIMVQLDEELIATGRAELADGPVRRKDQVMLGDFDCQAIGQLRSTRCASDKPRLPSEHARKECPGVQQDGSIIIDVLGKNSADRFGVNRALA